MAALPPKIDQRTYEEIIKKTETLAEQFSDWQPVQGKTDAGGALIRIFARMVKLVSNRLNQVPEKNFLAFLDLIGGQLKPPQPAKVPLTFYLVEGSPVDGLVPAHTQVSAPPAEASEEEIVFETDRELVVTTAQLQAVYVRQPSQDKYSDRTWEATGQKDAAFFAFEGDRPIPHYLYISCTEIFALPELTNFQLIITTNNGNQFQELLQSLNWSYWDGFKWKEITSNYDGNENKFTFPNLATPTNYEINGNTARWLQAKLTDIYVHDNLPQVSNIQGKINIAKADLIPEVCLFNNIFLDLTKDFYPFGEQPELNDTFYLALHDTLIKPNTIITINISLSHKPLEIDKLKIIWEIGNGEKWQEIGNQNHQVKWIENYSAIQFTEGDNIQAKLQFPNQENLPAPSIINGETPYWIRARIIQGHYGQPSKTRKYAIYNEVAIVNDIPANNQIKIVGNASDFLSKNDIIRLSWIENSTEKREEYQIKNITESTIELNTNLSEKAKQKGTKIFRRDTITETISPTYDPPAIKSLKLTYNFALEEDSIYLAKNDFNYSYPNNNNFGPFTSTVDKEPTLYLGFDNFFDNKTVTLYAQIEPPLSDELSTDIRSETLKPQLVWEYSSPNGWQPLGVQNETQAFSQSGLIQFIAPVDFSKIETFGKQLYWLRIRWQSGTFRVKPRLRRILTNTTWAIQAISLKEEVLGSSNYEPNQIFIANNTPILIGQQLEVAEAQIPPELESDRIKIIRDDVGEIEEVWVLWQEVADFYGSGADNRHYILDRQTGEIRFGDGQTGMIPPRGRNNIRLSFYRTGGGKQGNIASRTINQLKTTIPYIDRVINLEPCGGGAEQETLERLKQRVPKQLRHRHRAVTIEDFEDLAYEASTDVARVKVVTADLLTANFSPLNENFWLDTSKPDISFEDSLNDKLQKINDSQRDNFKKMMQEINRRGGQVKLIILPYSGDRQPIPSLALLEQVETYIRSRCQATVDLLVTAPKWEKVSVNATITPISLEGADMIRNTVKQRLEAFLHPLSGGTGEGWQFGRYPQKSDFYAIIQSISGVDYVNSLEISLSSTEANSSLSADTLIYSGNHIINLK
ncbi:MAG: baseplate protein J [Richelia sp. RM1_1_1]|nr:baseplate protein J [Richelia sp. RM1_1_1]